MSVAVEAMRSARQLLQSIDESITKDAQTAEAHAAMVEQLEVLVSSLQDANTILKARLGESSEETGGAVAKALRAAVVFVFTERGAKTPRNAVLWLKSCGWGESGSGSFIDPVTRDSFLLANAVDMQTRRDLASFQTLINTQ